MKTKLPIAISILVVCLLPVDTSAQGGEKIYRITDEGEYQFIYTRDYVAGNGIVHPVTARTFYLETKRAGLLPETVSYNAYLQLADGHLQAMVEASQEDVIASLNNSPKHIAAQEGSAHEVAPATSGTFAEIGYSGNCESGICYPTQTIQIAGEETPALPPAKQINRTTMALAQPGEEVVPGLTRKDGEASKDTSYSQVRTKIPWIVQLMLMEGEMPYENWYDRETIPALTATEAEKRVRLHNLVEHLLTYQDDSIQQEYGKVFPGMDGKLYGISDAELDEVVHTLLQMKDDFLASCEPELHHIFNEMETLALNR